MELLVDAENVREQLYKLERPNVIRRYSKITVFVGSSENITLSNIGIDVVKIDSNTEEIADMALCFYCFYTKFDEWKQNNTEIVIFSKDKVFQVLADILNKEGIKTSVIHNIENL